MQQDVDVSKYAKTIDGKKQKFIVNGYERTLNQGPRSDQGILRVQCFDESKNDTLYNHSSDSLMSIGKWQTVADTFTAPLHTRFIRVQLVDVLNFGAGIDGYFDNISLVAVPSPNYLLTIIIVAAMVIVAGLVWYFQKKKINNKKNHYKSGGTGSKNW